jgi:hypothetical protein
LAARLTSLVLRWANFFLFRHGENESIVAGLADASACPALPRKKTALF